MAEENKKGDIGFADIISSVDKASADELAALARIEKKLTARSGASGSDKQSASNLADNSVPRSVQLAEMRRRQREDERRKAVKEKSNSSNSAVKNKQNSSSKPTNENSSHLTYKNQSNDENLAVARTKKHASSAKQSHDNKESVKLNSDDNHLEVKKKARQEALKSLRSASRINSQPQIEANGRVRDENGKFTSRDKVNQDKSVRHDAENARHSETEEKKGQALITRLAKALSESSDPLDASSTNAAGMAAGGSY